MIADFSVVPSVPFSRGLIHAHTGNSQSLVDARHGIQLCYRKTLKYIPIMMRWPVLMMAHTLLGYRDSDDELCPVLSHSLATSSLCQYGEYYAR